MVTESEIRVRVETDADMVPARARAREAAAGLGFSRTDGTIIATATSEITRNILVHAGAGEIVIETVRDGHRRGVRVAARDRGPGIADIEAALRTGYGSRGGLGLGLPGTRRLMDELEIESESGKGTTVTMTKWRALDELERLRETARLFETGTAARPRPGETESGDAAVVRPLPDGALIAVVDGLGHGPQAAAAADAATAVLTELAGEPLPSLIASCHDALGHTRGAALSVASYSAPAGTLTWVGIGNVEGRVVRGDPSTPDAELVPSAGAVGDRFPPVSPTTVAVALGDVLVFATDGVDRSFGDGLELTGSAQAIAQRILDAHARDHDDALVVVARLLGDER